MSKPYFGPSDIDDARFFMRVLKTSLHGNCIVLICKDNSMVDHYN